MTQSPPLRGRGDHAPEGPGHGATAGSGAAATPAPPSSRPRGLRALAGWQLRGEHAVVLALGLLVVVVHNVGYILSQSYWNDEAWVAVTTRFPLSDLPATTSSTPIGWSALLRLVTIPRTETGRLMPLAFAGATVVVAYWFAKRLGWRWQPAATAAAVVAAGAALLVPGMLVRDDLKQYTAEAFTTLLTLALTSRLEREWSRRWLAALSVSVWAGMLISNAVAFVGVTAFLALCLLQLVRRSWRRLAESAVAGTVTAVLMLAVYETFDARAVAPLVASAYWPRFYLPVTSGFHAALAFITSHFDAAAAFFGLGPVWLAVPLVIAGYITIARLGRPATALAVAGLWPELLLLSALRKYPFLNFRTSTFLFAATAVVAAIGLIGVCSVLRPYLRGGLAAGVAGIAVAAFIVGALPYVRSHRIPNEDIRQQTAYVAAHAKPRDVILVNLNSNWGFAYYWPFGQPSRRPDNAVKQLYEAYFPQQHRIVLARNRNAAGVDAALSQALAKARQEPGCSRLWLVRTHMITSEARYWKAAFAQDGVKTRHAGPHGLRFVQMGGPSCQAAAS